MSDETETKPKPAAERMKLEDVVTPIFDLEMGQRLALMRMRRFWKQSELCERLRLNQTTLSEIELGRLPSPRHPFTVTLLEEIFGPRAAGYILLKRYAADFEPWAIGDKYRHHLVKSRKPRKKGEHWTHRRLRAGLSVRGTFENVAAADLERATKIIEESANRHTKSVKRKDKKAGQ